MVSAGWDWVYFGYDLSLDGVIIIVYYFLAIRIRAAFFMDCCYVCPTALGSLFSIFWLSAFYVHYTRCFSRK
jgi:hypothetical protein